jgi:endonuclease/exonuclease/phosphatase family metal-dependent hydrolase
MYRVITYNLHSGVGRDGIQDYARIGRFLADQNADFVLLQEMDTRSAEREVCDDISAICAEGKYMLIPAPTVTTKHGWYGNAILTRHPVLHRQQFNISVPNREPRTLQHVVVTLNKQPLSLLNAHLGLQKKERAYQARRLHEIMQSINERNRMPACLGGDMNEWWLNTRLFKRLDDEFQQLHTGRSFPSHLPLFKLDRIWTSPELKVGSNGRLTDKDYRHYSDHLAVQADFAISASTE